ncbi:MAG: tRNA-dihydrouridine synthase family protein [Desulfovibrionaceae bacterium]|nr:tRNA-dihydrouridine synthase family protein [Desulfovibrionaceae bacterium]
MLTQEQRKKLADRLKQPLRIGSKTISSRLVLAPLAGLNHQAMRESIAAFPGAGLLFTGMLSARAVPTENPRKSHAFSWNDRELPTLVGQLFGNEPEQMAVAARRLESEGFFGADINMGCSVAAIAKKKCGAGLLRHPELACEIVSAVRSAVTFPLMVKLRSGWLDDPAALENTIRLAQAFESAGVDAVTFHPRFSPDRRTRPPQLEHLKLFRQALKIPVFGNGNLCTAADCLHMLEKTGCDGLALGRMAIARPWLFHSLLNAEDEFENALGRLHDSATAYLNRLFELWEPGVARKYYKKFALYLSANFSSGSRMYGRLTKGENLDELQAALESAFAENASGLTRRPNMLMFSM